MSIAPFVGPPIATPGVWWVDAAAAPGGDGSFGKRFNDLQVALNAAYLDGTIRVIWVFPGTYTAQQNIALTVSIDGFELQNVAVRSVAGRASTILVAGSGLGFATVIMHEDALLEGFTIVPDVAAGTGVAFADTGPPLGLVGQRAIVRDVIIDATPIAPTLGGTVASCSMAGGSAQQNMLEDYEIRGGWDFGIANSSGNLFVRNGIVDVAARIDGAVVHAGGFGAVVPPCRTVVDGLRIPSSVVVTDDAFVADDDGILELSAVSVDGAGGYGVRAMGTGIIRGDNVRAVNCGVDLRAQDTATLHLLSAEFDPLSVTLTGTANVRLPDFSGTAVVLNTATSVVVAFQAGLDGKPVTATMLEADGAIAVANATWDGLGNLAIRTTAAVTADRTVAWTVHASAP